MSTRLVVSEDGREVATAEVRGRWAVFRIDGKVWRLVRLKDASGHDVWEKLWRYLARAVVSHREEQKAWAAQLRDAGTRTST